ncbi:MAG TPA: efflux RND transporter periplasmic adaptor subunit [Candidatus Alistipes faecigallinarum]|uniref:efflux RND transporter periplasmic adaptor subunit n=1 Tax=uncultured Alistipes sp. TaxID=538949 RepID=UPI001F87ABF2|nr:efflux RND transporter periplasmic adaptor subunit [uncultured Alistipes sp.]HIY46578.1 efflux RND transporter periplasmic adaptor subunit [Candidatus Alistipes faecigallinarum]
MNLMKMKPDLKQLDLGKWKNEVAERMPRVSVTMNRKRWIMLVCALVVLAGGLWWWLRPRPVPVVLPVVATQPVETQDVSIYGEYVGRIRAQQFVEIRARVEGYLEKMLFTEGTYIERGQTLFVIDPRLYRARANKARAQLNKAQAQALKAQRDLERIRPLYEQSAASQLDLDNAIASYESAAADVVVCEADLTQAEMILGYTTVKSPVSGYISERNVDIGTLVGPSGKSLLATVVKSDTVRVDFSMTALDYLRSKARNVNLGQKDTTRKWNPYITVTLADGSQYPYRGLVDFADPQVDPQTGTFSVRAEMANPDRILLPGQFTKVKLLLDVREDAVVVPSKALVIEKGGAYIFVVRPDSVVEKRFVETGPEIPDNKVVIERGLSSDERIVVEGYHKLQHGIKVEPVAPIDEEESATERKE